MNSRRFACFLIGLWLGAGLLTAWLTTDSFHSVDRLLAHPAGDSAGMFKALGSNARTLLRYQVSEQNRTAFQNWELIQLAFGFGVFFFLLFGTREGKFSMALVLVMIVLTGAQKFFLTPEIIALGRFIDFAPPDGMQGERAQFWVLHSAYTVVEVAKWAVGLALLAKLVFSRRARSEDARDNLDSIDKRNNRHVNR